MTPYIAAVLAVLLGAWLVRRLISPPTPRTFDLDQLRQDLVASLAAESYADELKSHLDGLEAKFGKQIPVEELSKLQQFAQSKVAEVERRRQEIINSGAAAGKTVSLQALRQRLEASKAQHTGDDRDIYAKEIDGAAGLSSSRLRPSHPS